MVARAQPLTGEGRTLYERDFCLWAEQQARLLREGQLEELDVVNLIDDIEDLSIKEKKALESDLVVVLKHLLKCRYQARRRSRSWLSSIAEHRRRLRNDLATSPSLRPYARERFDQCYLDGRRQALIEPGLAANALPSAPPYSLEQTLDPEFLPTETGGVFLPNRLDGCRLDSWRRRNWRHSAHQAIGPRSGWGGRRGDARINRILSE
jgi:hypothetical protein